jgi:hypothetical protein
MLAPPVDTPDLPPFLLAPPVDTLGLSPFVLAPPVDTPDLPPFFLEGESDVEGIRDLFRLKEYRPVAFPGFSPCYRLSSSMVGSTGVVTPPSSSTSIGDTIVVVILTSVKRPKFRK